MRTDKSVNRMARNIAQGGGKAFALLATMHKGFCANGTTLIFELYETSNNLSDQDWQGC